ncbi:hypothetical protein EV2_020143 [Malus domestica]
MEGDQSAGLGRDPFEYQFSLYHHDSNNPFANNHSMQIPSMENNAAEHVVDLESSTDSPQPMDPIKSTETLTETEFNFLNPSHEQPANLAPNEISFSALFAEAMENNPQIIAQPNPEELIPPISNAPNLSLPPLPEVTFNHLLRGASQPYPPYMEELELGSSAGNNWSGLNPANSTQNFMPGAAVFPSYQSSSPLFLYPQNQSERTRSFFNPPMPNSAPEYRPMYIGNVMAEPFHQETNPVVHPYPQQEQLPLSLTLGPNQYGTRTMMAGLGGENQRPSYLNQQPAALFYPQCVNSATQLSTPSGFWPQHNQVIQGNGAFNPQGNNFVPYGAAQIRPQATLQLLNPTQRANQPQQLNRPQCTQQSLNQAQPENQPEQLNKIPQNTFPAGEFGPWILESSLVRALPQQQEQTNKGKAILVHEPQNSNSNPLMQSGPQKVAKSLPTLPIPVRPRPSVLPTIADPPHHSSAPSKTQMPFRLSPIHLEETMNQSNVTSDRSSQRSSQLRSSPTEKGETPEQLGFSEKRGKRPEGESSPAKRSKRNSAASSRSGVNRSTFEPQEKKLDLFSNFFVPTNPRPMKNSHYDPAFEAMGLPIDPHIRMFLASQQNPPAKK